MEAGGDGGIVALPVERDDVGAVDGVAAPGLEGGRAGHLLVRDLGGSEVQLRRLWWCGWHGLRIDDGLCGKTHGAKEKAFFRGMPLSFLDGLEAHG